MKLITRALALVGILATVQCGSSSSPVAPSASVAVALSGSSVAVGGTVQGTVSLSAPASTALSVALGSSNAAVATVPASATIAAGAANATFTVTGVAPGSATVTATANGATAQSATLTVTAPRVALAAVSLSAASVVEGGSVTGTITLSAAAPTGGAVVSISGSDAVIIPTTVTVPAGATSATFTLVARPGSGATSATVTASYAGASMSATLTITKPTVATANFGVTGPSETETCEMANGGTTLACTFNASTSTAPGTIVAYDWTYAVAGKFSQTTTGAVLTNPTVDCSLMPPPPLPAGAQWLTLTVTLTIHDDRGNVAQASDSGARLLPKGTCGY